jgi:hypothetical protein
MHSSLGLHSQDHHDHCLLPPHLASLEGLQGTHAHGDVAPMTTVIGLPLEPLLRDPLDTVLQLALCS